MGTNNVKALWILGGTFEQPFFFFDNHKICKVYDPPHLLKCTRNLFLKYPVQLPVQCGIQKTVGTADVNIIREAWEMDRREIFRMVPKLTAQHVNPDTFSKMRVSLAAQLLSHSVASLLLSGIRQGLLPASEIATVTFVQEMDLLFDSCNGSQLYSEAGKEFRTALRNNSTHLQFWEEIATKISQWQFVGCKLRRPPFQRGWLSNLHAIPEIWKDLQRRQIDHLRTRSLNQDALENLFGGIRSYCGDNNNPTCLQFVSCMKTHLLNSLSSIELRGTNCETDYNEFLTNFRNILQKRSCETRNPLKADETTNKHQLDQLLECVSSTFDENVFQPMFK